MNVYRYTYIGVPGVDSVLRADPRRKRVRVVRLHPLLPRTDIYIYICT